MPMQIVRTVIDGKEIKGRGRFVRNPYSWEIVAVYEEIVKLPPVIKRQTFENNQNLQIIFEKLADELDKDRNRIALMVSSETGSPIKDNLEDINDVATYLRQIYTYRDKSNYLLTPKGVVLLALSANEPIILGTIPLATALLCGNKVFVKPSSKSPSFSYYIVKQLLSLGIHYGNLGFLALSRECYQNMIKKSYFDTILSFATNRVNQKLSQLASLTDTEFISESEGNDWMYIDDIEQFSEDEIAEIIIRGITKHNGQMCDSVRGIFVNKSIYKPILNKVKQKLKRIKVGDPKTLSTDVGALLLDTFDSVEKYVVAFKPYVEKTFNYKSNSKHNIINPTILENISFDSLQSVINPCFGPVCFINSVDNVSSFITIYNTYNKYGLCFSLFASKKDVIRKVINEINVGRLNVNTNPVDVVASSPWGGVKLSGYGGPKTWEERFTNRKLVNIGNYSK